MPDAATAGSSPKQIVWYGLAFYVAVMAIVTGLFVMNHRTPSLSFAISLSVPLLSFSIIPLFFLGLHDFKYGLRRAFTFICFGIVLYSLAPLQFPAVDFFHLEALANTGIVVLPYIVAVGLLFWGVRRFGHLLKLRAFWFSPWWALAFAVAAAVGVGFMPHVHTNLSATAFATVNGLNLWCGMILFFAAMGILRIRRATATRYQASLGWLLAGVGVNVFAAIHYTTVNLLLPATSWYAANSVLVPALLGAVFFILAGYAFSNIKTTEATAQTITSPIEVIDYAAGLASDPHQIDPVLDRLREITAKLPTSGKSALTTEQEAKLAATYTQIEDYLVTSEPLQNFTRAGLREIVRTKFQFNAAAQSAFWSLFIDPGTVANASEQQG